MEHTTDRPFDAASWQDLARALLGDFELTPADVAQRSGVDLEQARRLWRALGFPPVPDDERAFTTADVAILKAVNRLVAQGVTDTDVLLQLTRVTGQALARVADAQVAATAERLGSTARRETLVDATRALVPALEPLITYVLRRHLLAAVYRHGVRADGRPAGPELAVGFADLVGFTAVTQQLEERELAAIVDRFEAIAYEQIVGRRGRVVKMIGDEVMFAVEDPAAAAEIALAVADAFHGEPDVPNVRVGLALGPALAWEGDLFGPVVNLASRLVAIARPATVLVSEALREHIGADARFLLRGLRPLKLKGVGRVRVWVLRPADGSPA
jgi:adenylate cyclase